MSIKDIKDRAPNEGLIRTLESMLEDAKSGAMRTMFSVCGWDDDGVSHGWVLDARNSRRRLLAEMVIAQHDFVVNIEMQEKDSVLYRAISGPDV